jgi:hypothetical protein
MAGQIIISNIKTDSDNAFSILANTGAVLFSANLASGITTNIANTRITGNIVSSQITSVSNTQITGTITASQLATSLNLATNNVQVASIQSATGTPALTIAANGQIASVNTVTANVTTLNAPSGVLATQNGMTGIPKAWLKYSYNGTTLTINGSFNISSVTRNSSGKYTYVFTTNMVDANYSVVPTSGIEITNGTSIIPIIFFNSADVTPTTSTFAVMYVAPSTGGVYDPKVVCLTVNGN